MHDLNYFDQNNNVSQKPKISEVMSQPWTKAVTDGRTCRWTDRRIDRIIDGAEIIGHSGKVESSKYEESIKPRLLNN